MAPKDERRTPRDTGAEPTKQTYDEQCLLRSERLPSMGLTARDAHRDFNARFVRLESLVHSVVHELPSLRESLHHFIAYGAECNHEILTGVLGNVGGHG